MSFAGPNSTRQRVGLGIGALLSLINLPSVLTPTPEGETGPPFAILVLGSVLGLVGLVAAFLAWRGNRGAVRVLAGSVIITTLSAMPAFFVDVPAWLKLGVGVAVLLAVAAVVLMFTPDRQRAAVPAMD